ncbi:hypothetical protein H9W90_14565 [Polaribacter pectinis]|uniref:Lipocalin-like domain-containing protein n=1 Tax=Polaribacter pectinis TaxID=2738844 RepID=A0A7G9L9U2_9FLAO|nr:lipocalin family protein [Polaribacter pectinis]QNM85391.1 hypothetical protein H9W90_14565 [Polaribacter pectinis]
MKRLLLSTFILLIIISCSKNEELEGEPEIIDPRESYFAEAIIGSWSINTVKVDGQIFLYPHTDSCKKDFFQFYNEQGKEFDFEETIVLNCDNCAPCATSTTNLRWELSGAIIKFYFGEQYVTKYKLIDVTETEFTYQLEIDYDNDGDLDVLEISAEYYDPYGNFD